MGKLGQKQCGPKCYYKALGKIIYKKMKGVSKMVKPKENPTFLRNARLLRKIQIENYNSTYCELCKKFGQVEAHHIIYRSEKPGFPELHSRMNLILLCHYHHEWIHESKQNRKQLVIDRGLDKIFGDDVIK